jgi:DNA (cytosine-5)-methyltransferase 1
VNRVLHLFAGAGGSHLTGKLLGWQSVGSVEIDKYCQLVLKNHYPNEEIHGDIRTFSAKHLVGKIDGICGGFPCQDISIAGKGKGITGKQSGLWKQFARVIGESEPSWVFIENSPRLQTRGLETVLEDLAEIGFNAEWSTFKAKDVGANHKRDRMFILAYSTKMFSNGCNVDGCKILKFGNCGISKMEDQNTSRWWSNDPADLPESQVGRVVNGMADKLLRWNRVHALGALGNGWVPLQAAEAFKQLMKRVIFSEY